MWRWRWRCLQATRPVTIGKSCLKGRASLKAYRDLNVDRRPAGLLNYIAGLEREGHPGPIHGHEHCFVRLPARYQRKHGLPGRGYGCGRLAQQPLLVKRSTQTSRSATRPSCSTS